MSNLEEWGREIGGNYETKQIKCEVVVDEKGGETYVVNLPNGMEIIVNVEHRDDMFLESLKLQLPENVTYDEKTKFYIQKWPRISEFRLSPKNELDFGKLFQK